jgi:hypothetical protein
LTGHKPVPQPDKSTVRKTKMRIFMVEFKY